MKDEPLVTIYIPSKNYGKYLDKAVKSVLNQIYSNWELYIIDEGSNDDTEKIAKNFIKKFPTKIKFILNSQPVGLQKLANHILEIANGKYIIRLDADDWLHEVALLIMVKKLEENSKAGIAYGNYFYTNEKGKIIGIERRHELGKEDLVGHLPPHGACTLVETNALRNVNGYTENVDAQDGWDLWFKLYKKIGAISIDLPLFYYRQHYSSLSKDNERLLNARAKIFHEIRSKEKNNFKPKVLAVIPVKESYPNMKDVPYQKINGTTLLEIAINNALGSNQIDELIVSSKSKNVLSFSKKLEEENKVKPHLRLLREESKDSKNIPITNFMNSAAELFFKNKNQYPDIIVYLSLHAINRKTSHIDKAINNLIITESDSVVSVQEEREPMFNYGKSGLNLINPGRFRKLTFDKERLYRFNGSIIATLWNCLKENKLFGTKTSFIEMSYKDSIQVKDSSLFDKH
ncbi:MAG: glycosyltransferase family 2 protein [Flammeovirgaceae bacterium]